MDSMQSPTLAADESATIAPMSTPVRAGSRALVKELHALTVNRLSAPGATKDAEHSPRPPSRDALWSEASACIQRAVRGASPSREASPRHGHLTMLAVAGTGFEPATSGL